MLSLPNLCQILPAYKLIHRGRRSQWNRNWNKKSEKKKGKLPMSILNYFKYKPYHDEYIKKCSPHLRCNLFPVIKPGDREWEGENWESCNFSFIPSMLCHTITSQRAQADEVKTAVNYTHTHIIKETEGCQLTGNKISLNTDRPAEVSTLVFPSTTAHAILLILWQRWIRRGK